MSKVECVKCGFLNNIYDRTCGTCDCILTDECKISSDSTSDSDEKEDFFSFNNSENESSNEDNSILYEY